MAKPKRPAYTYGGCTANEVYDILNGRYFRGRLPKIPVQWKLPYAKNSSKHRTVAGATHFNLGKGNAPIRICLNPKYKSCGAIWVMTLIHEMIHVEQYKLPESQSHGRKFQKRMKQLANKGAFNGLW